MQRWRFDPCCCKSIQSAFTCHVHCQTGTSWLPFEERWVRYISVMRLRHVSIANALGSGPTTSVKFRKPMLGTATVHSALATSQCLEQLQVHLPPSLVSIVIASTPVGTGKYCRSQRSRPNPVAGVRTCGGWSRRSQGVARPCGTRRRCWQRPHSSHKSLALILHVGLEDDSHRASA